MAHCIRTKTVLSGLGGRVTRCAKFSGLGATKKRKAKKAEYARGEDTALIEWARETGRILLTRDTGLVRRRDVPPHILVLSDHVSEQLRQVIQTFHQTPAGPSARRCPRCNAAVEPRTKAEVFGRVPEFVWSSQDAFWGCPVCGRLYWAGSHWRHMDDAIRGLLA